MSHFFTHSPVDGHLDCIHGLTPVNSVALNTGVYRDFQIMVFWGYMPRVGLLDHMAALVFTFCEEPPHCSPEWLY